MSATDLRARARALAVEAAASGQADALRTWIEEALDAGKLQSKAVSDAPPEVPRRFGMIGQSRAMRDLFDLIERVAPSDVPVLIRGETGSGKELVARALHDQSRRSAGPFVAVNCAAVAANLLESELFGHVRGSFTGAVNDHAGHFVSAEGGTLFLDEIGDMALDMQAKLLRALQEGEVRAVGASRIRKVDVRVVAATHQDLAAMMGEGTFREDLYFRLNVVTLVLPALRERDGDVRLLVQALLGGLAEDVGKPRPEISEEALAALEAWSWPGNVRELENELRRAIALGGHSLGIADLSPAIQAP